MFDENDTPICMDVEAHRTGSDDNVTSDLKMRYDARRGGDGVPLSLIDDRRVNLEVRC